MPVPPGYGISEFNHHLAGLMVLIIGASAILIALRPNKFGFLKYVWPACVLAFGIYLMLYGDPEAWPSGYKSLAASLQDAETRQHKIYALLLILMGGIELARTANIAKSPTWKYAFPTLALIGALYLIMHRHGAEMMHNMPEMHDMSETDHLKVLYQHIFYIVLGVGIAATKILYDTQRLKTRWAPYLWPSLTVLLGLALILYTE
jgi:hypothetical protein